MALFGLLLRAAWPAHEDEVLALFAGREPLGGLLRTVVTERGGAPLHFLLAWVVVHLGGGLGALRLVSTAFAAGSIPLVALLARRLVGRPGVAFVAALLAGSSWLVLFNAVFARMYSLFLFTSTLSFLALLAALELGGRRRFALWGLALLATLAAHPYGVLVLVGQAVFVGLRRRRDAAATLCAVAVLAAPLWWADLVLRNRFSVGAGGSGSALGAPRPVLRYLWAVAADATTGFALPVVLALAAWGFILLRRRRRQSAQLVGLVLLVPASALLLVRLGPAASPETRHLIFALPFLATLVAVPLVELQRPLALAAAVALATAELAWAYQRTPELFRGEPAARVEAREAAAHWLARTGRPEDVLFGYSPVFGLAWERNRPLAPRAVPRADPRLLADALHAPLGRGVWVLDAGAPTNRFLRSSIPDLSPDHVRFASRRFGPYLVLRTRAREGSPRQFLQDSKRVMELAARLELGDAGPNLRAIDGALAGG